MTPKQHEKRPRSRIPLMVRSNTNQLAMAEHVDSADERSRQLSTPTGIIPKQHEKRPRSLIDLMVRSSTSSLTGGSPRRLSPTTVSKWKSKEDVAIVKFILLSTPGDNWPTMSGEVFWKSAALFVHQSSQEPLRSSE